MTAEQTRIYRNMSPAQKLSLAAMFYLASRRLKASGLMAQHPEWSEQEIQNKVREMFLYAAD